jgi:UDP-GlcNAc:undecaprenyl-phosphate/decaprenyl-phosphate GlcNAc-1-phosphate transferase
MNFEHFENLILFPLLFSFIISIICTPLAIKFAWHYKIIDDPAKNKHPKVIHTYPVPRGGVIPIIISFVVTSLFFLPIDKHLVGIILGSLIAATVGLIDDKFNLNPYVRIITCTICALVVVVCGVGIPYINNPLGGIINLDQPRIIFSFLGDGHSIWLLADILAILWIVWCMNIINWSSGLDGQISGVVPIAAITIAMLSLRNPQDITQWPVAILAAICAGAYLGFLPFHLFPQKIMPGFGGTTLAGFLLAVLAILAGAKINTAVIVLGIPMFDGVWTVIRRVMTGHSPFWGDRGHLHHRLLDLGWSKKSVATFYWIITGILGILVLNLNSEQKFYTIVTLVIIIGGVLLWLNYLKALSSHSDQPNG